MRCWILFAALLLAAPAAAQAPARAPRFEDFPAVLAPPARNAPVVLATAEARRYRTRLREAAAQPPNFAGHYVLATWGCGTDCLMGAAVNTRSGRVTFMPGPICCIFAAADETLDKIEYRADSALLVLTGMRDEDPKDLGRHYYRMERDRFVHLLDIPVAARP